MINYMNYKDYYASKYDLLCEIKNIASNTTNEYFQVTMINEQIINDNFISIVMTTCDRPVQTYFTLKTFSQSLYKNIQVIIVDDGVNEPLDIDILTTFNIHIELVRITKKIWINPCIGYNIGFNRIRGGKVIIQNSEVCHIGDIIAYVRIMVNDNEYHSFDVYAMNTIDENKKLYDINDLSYDNKETIIAMPGMWYQHPIHRNANFHFLTAMTINSFRMVNEFHIDYSVGIDYDDYDFVLTIIENGIAIICPDGPVMGIHQWHPQTACGSGSGKVFNKYIDDIRRKYHREKNAHLHLTSFTHEEFQKIIEEWF